MHSKIFKKVFSIGFNKTTLALFHSPSQPFARHQQTYLEWIACEVNTHKFRSHYKITGMYDAFNVQNFVVCLRRRHCTATQLHVLHRSPNQSSPAKCSVHDADMGLLTLNTHRMQRVLLVARARKAIHQHQWHRTRALNSPFRYIFASTTEWRRRNGIDKKLIKNPFISRARVCWFLSRCISNFWCEFIIIHLLSGPRSPRRKCEKVFILLFLLVLRFDRNVQSFPVAGGCALH